MILAVRVSKQHSSCVMERDPWMCYNMIEKQKVATSRRGQAHGVSLLYNKPLFFFKNKLHKTNINPFRGVTHELITFH